MFSHSIPHFILRHRFSLLIIFIGLTVFMGYQATKVRFSYQSAQILPENDPDFQLYESFKARYGDDGDVLVIGVATDRMFSLPVFKDWYELNRKIKNYKGVKDVISGANLLEIVRNDSLKRFDFSVIPIRKPDSQQEIDSIKAKISRLPFYRERIISKDSKAHLMAIALTQDALKSKYQNLLFNQIKHEAQAFGKAHGIEVHLSGLSYIRTEFAAQVRQEAIFFTILALLVTGVILLLFFRSTIIMLVSLAVVLIGVVWSLGLMALLNHEINQLTGLIPSLVVVIGVSNSLFLTNNYREEMAHLPNQHQALQRAVEKTVASFSWVTTVIGFGVFYLTNGRLFEEFGLIAALSVLGNPIIYLIISTIIYSYLPAPIPERLVQPESKYISLFLKKADEWVHDRRPAIYTMAASLLIVSAIGITQLKVENYLPKNNPTLNGSAFFEKHFKGIMPFEVTIDTGRPGRVMTPQTLTKIKLLQKEFTQYPEFTKPVSVVETAKFIYQSYRSGDSAYFVLPDAIELAKLAEYAGTFKANNKRLRSLMDTTGRYTRVSFQIADIGTHRIKFLYSMLQPKIDSLLNIDAVTGKKVEKEEKYEIHITGRSVVFAKENDYLWSNSIKSMLLGFVCITTLMVILFGHWRLILSVAIQSVIPLLMTAGIMGFSGIYLSPATALIFSISFGLISNDAIYFLTNYRNQFITPERSISEAVSHTIQSTGIRMFYNTLILFAGFAIFTASVSKATAALGILVAITLLMGMLSNLILLPAFLGWINKKLLNS